MEPQSIAFYLVLIGIAAFVVVTVYAAFNSQERRHRRELDSADQKNMAETRRDMLKRPAGKTE